MRFNTFKCAFSRLLRKDEILCTCKWRSCLHASLIKMRAYVNDMQRPRRVVSIHRVVTTNHKPVLVDDYCFLF